MKFYPYLAFLMAFLLSCGGPAEQTADKIAGDLKLQSSGDLLRIGENGNSVTRWNAQSPYYQRFIQRQRPIALAELQKVKPNASIAVQLPKGIPKKIADDIASLVRSAVSKPNRNTIIAVAAGAGLITALYVLEEEEEKSVEQEWRLQPGAEALAVPKLLSEAEIYEKIGRYQAISEERSGLDLREPPQPPKAVGQALKLTPSSKLPQLYELKVQQERWIIGTVSSEGLQVKFKARFPPLPKGGMVYAYFYDEDKFLLKGKGLYQGPETGGARVARVLPAANTAQTLGAGQPARMFLPYTGISEQLEADKLYLCRLFWEDGTGQMKELGHSYFSL
jgi:hypothetical protein